MTGLRFAYADPPYVGQSKRHYRTHADYAGEVDHHVIGQLVASKCPVIVFNVTHFKTTGANTHADHRYGLRQSG